MISFKKYFQIYFFVIFCSIFLNISSIADDDTEKKNLLDQTKEAVEELGKKEKANTSLDLEKDEFDEDVPLLNGALLNIICRVDKLFQYHSHSLVVGIVQDVRSIENQESLIYHL